MSARTVADWLNRAAEATDPGEIEAHIDAAYALATSCHDLRSVLRCASARPELSPPRVAEIADRTLRAAVKERAIWGFRDVATVRADRLGDEAGARAALDAGAVALRRGATETDETDDALDGWVGPTRGYEWVLLGDGYVETLHDPEGQRACLVAGRDLARATPDAEDLCNVATAWAALDEGAAVRLLHEAEAVRGDGAASPWSLANAWHALGEPDAARRVLDTAREEAQTTARALHVARAWACHESPDDARAAVDRARELAAGATDWLDIAEDAFDAALGEHLVREAVEQAEAAAGADEELRARVARAYQQLLSDPAASARVGPRGERPEALRATATPLDGWHASASGLFDWLRERMTLEALTVIARADYGHDAARHLAALQDICETGLVPRTLAWEPHEVLALTRWSTGERVDHLARAFCCVLLCLSPSDMDELVTNGPILAESCLALGPEATDLAGKLFAWLAQTADDDDPERPIALVLLWLMAAASAPDDPRLEALAGRVRASDRSPHALPADLRESMGAPSWDALLELVALPLRATHPSAARLLTALAR